MASTKVVDLYPSHDEFEERLENARMAASTDWEEDFVKTAISKFEKFGNSMFWSEAQDGILRKIADDD